MEGKSSTKKVILAGVIGGLVASAHGYDFQLELSKSVLTQVDIIQKRLKSTSRCTSQTTMIS